MSNSWIYCRVSTGEQARNGGSLPEQERQCRQAVSRIGLKLGTESNYNNPGVFCDPGVSAWKVPIMDRPGFQSLWKVAKPGDRISILSLDRAFRSVRDFSTTWPVFESRDVLPVFVRENIDMSTPTGKLIGTVSAAFAEYKSNLMSARIKEGLSFKRSGILATRPGGNTPVNATEIVQAYDPLMVRLSGYKHPETPLLVRGRVYGYTRVSTDRQKTGAQREIVQRYMQTLAQDGYTPAEIYDDHGVSAFGVSWCQRPAGKILFDKLEPGDIVCVSRSDRAFRSIIDMSHTMKILTDKNIHVVSNCGIDTRSLAGQHLIEIVTMMAKWESDLIGWRTRMGLQAIMSKRGRWFREDDIPKRMNKIVLPNGTWTVRVDERWLEEARMVRELRDSGMTWPEISEEMEDRLMVRDGRMRLPKGQFTEAGLTRLFSSRNYSAEQREGLKRWFARKRLERHREGKFSRDWLAASCNNEMKNLTQIEEILAESDD